MELYTLVRTDVWEYAGSKFTVLDIFLSYKEARDALDCVNEDKDFTAKYNITPAIYETLYDRFHTRTNITATKFSSFHEFLSKALKKPLAFTNNLVTDFENLQNDDDSLEDTYYGIESITTSLPKYNV